MQHFLKDMIARLAQGRVEFVIVGGVSAVLHGVPLVTVDLDVCYRRTPDNIARLAGALAPLNPCLRGLPPELPSLFDERTLLLGTNFTLDIGGESIDLLGEMSAIGGYEQIIGRAEAMVVAGFPVRVLALADLIATKEAAGRAKDHAALPLLKATLELKRQQDQSRNEPPAPA